MQQEAKPAAGSSFPFPCQIPARMQRWMVASPRPLPPVVSLLGVQFGTNSKLDAESVQFAIMEGDDSWDPGYTSPSSSCSSSSSTSSDEELLTPPSSPGSCSDQAFNGLHRRALFDDGEDDFSYIPASDMQCDRTNRFQRLPRSKSAKDPLQSQEVHVITPPSSSVPKRRSKGTSVRKSIRCKHPVQESGSSWLRLLSTSSMSAGGPSVRSSSDVQDPPTSLRPDTELQEEVAACMVQLATLPPATPHFHEILLPVVEQHDEQDTQFLEEVSRPSSMRRQRSPPRHRDRMITESHYYLMLSLENAMMQCHKIHSPLRDRRCRHSRAFVSERTSALRHEVPCK